MFNFKIEKEIPGSLGRAGIYKTPHGPIETPCFDVVGTKATVKGLTVEMLKDIGAQVFLANTYHLHIDPTEERIKEAGGLHKFSGWNGPMVTDSGGFQAFSLGAAFGSNVSKVAKPDSDFIQTEINQNKQARAKISEEGVAFKSHKSGKELFFSPEKSVQIQQDLGADIYFVLDECVSPQASIDYQKQAIDRTHRWAERCLAEHKKYEAEKKDLSTVIETDGTKHHPQALFGIVQGGRHLDLREYSAKHIGAMDFDGFGIGGAFDKYDMEVAVAGACKLLPKEKPRHLLGIGEIEDIFLGVENGIDMFDCVAPTRSARHGNVHTKNGKVNLKSSAFRNQHSPIERNCGCYTCKNHTASYISHLIREGEILGATLASIHNLHFILELMRQIRQAIKDDKFFELKQDFLSRYKKISKNVDKPVD